MMQRLCFDKGSEKPTGTNIPDLKEPFEATVPSKPKPNKKKKGKAAEVGKNEGTPLAQASRRQLPCKSGKVSAWTYEMFGHVNQTDDRYLELSCKDRKSISAKAVTPCIDDHLIPPEEFEVKGALAPIAARVVLKALYVAPLVMISCGL